MQSLWPRVRGLLFFGWVVAVVRFVLDANGEPGGWKDPGWYVSVYFLMPLALLFVGLRRTWDDLRWPKFILVALLLGFLVWGVPNAISYTTAQFMGWKHGRFGPGHGPPTGETTLAKIGIGLAIGGGTGLVGSVHCLLCSTLFIWLPGKIRRNRKAKPA
jgi:hypothetical protein